MSIIRKISAELLAATALTIWGCSLALTGIVLYFEEKHLAGLEILATGWLSPIMLNFAWFANIFFLYGILRLFSTGVPIKSAILATLLSFDTFRFTHYLLNENGGTSPVYGYGWGAVLWFSSIFLMLAAVGKRRREINISNRSMDTQEWLQPLGFVLLSATLGASSYFSIHDRMVANSTETQRLTNIAFKRGTVCGAPDPIATDPIKKLSGPIELVVTKNAMRADYTFTQISDLLEWGIPTVRNGNIDYSYDARAGLVYSIPATGESAAILYINELHLHKISAKLVESSTNRIVFDQTWEQEDHLDNTRYYCPDYHSFPTSNEQPRKLLMQALNIKKTNIPSKEIDQETKPIDRIEGNIIEQSADNNSQAIKIERSNKNSIDSRASDLNYESFNTNCPIDIGRDARSYKSRQNAGQPFMVKGKSYYFQHRNHYNATCEGEAVYIYNGRVRDDKYYLSIQKRDLSDFGQVWERVVTISNVSSSIRDDALKMQSIKETNNTITMELVNDYSWKVILIQATLPD